MPYALVPLCSYVLLIAMRKLTILRAVFFVVFFSIGAATLALSILCDELVQHYQHRDLLKAAKQSNEHLQSLNTDYDALLRQLEKDPNLVKRIAPAVLGAAPADTNAIYPKATAELLDAAKEALAKDPNQRTQLPIVPDWIIQCSKPTQRIVLFLAGAALVLIPFMCFGSAKRTVRLE